jgi:hypothetical protein
MKSLLLILAGMGFFGLFGELASGQVAGGKKAEFQDEVRTPASREAPKQRRTAGADFQDSVWQAGRKEGENEEKQALYREPFVLESEEEMHALLDAAHDRTLALVKQEDPEHDGVIRTHNIRE